MLASDESNFLASFPVAGVLGHDIGYSLSPMLHAAAERASGRECDYQVFDIPPENLRGWLINAGSIDGIIGFNVTTPHKEDLARYLNAIHDSARQVGAVNTVAIRGGHLIGYNTDRPALQRVFRSAVMEEIHPSEGWTMVLMGAGGAARASVWAALDAGILKHLVVMSRNENRVHAMKNDFYVDFTRKGTTFSWHRWQDWATLYTEHPSILVNATPIGTDYQTWEGASDFFDISSSKLEMFDIVIDLVYNPPETALVRKATEAGRTAVGGGGMLIEQAVLSRSIWFGEGEEEKERAAMVAAYSSWARKTAESTGGKSS